MPKLPDNTFYEMNRSTGERFDMVCPTSVDAKTGTFKLIITREFFELLEAFPDICRNHNVTPRAEWTKRPANGNDKIYTILGSQLDAIKRAIKDGITEWLSTEVSEEVFIQYGMESTCHFWENTDGTIATNGSGADPKGGWSKISKTPNGWDSHTMFSLGVGATVVVQQTHHNSRGTTVKNVTLAGAKDQSLRDKKAHPVMNELNSFVHIRLRDDCPMMPYSDEAAQFFIDILMGLCNTSKRLSEFFADDARVSQAIENKAGMVLLGGKQ